MRLISWNVNGLRACVGKGSLDFFHEIRADAVCLQETKMQPDQLTLELVEKGLVTDQLVLTVGYDIENLSDPARCYAGATEQDPYGRKMPKHGHGTANLGFFHSSSACIVQAMGELFDRVADPTLSVRRLQISANHLKPSGAQEPMQLDLFGDAQERTAKLERERRQQQALIRIRSKYGKNAIFRGMNLLDGATARERNGQIGGHKA
jgi:DNA polymerase V